MFAALQNPAPVPAWRAKSVRASFARLAGRRTTGPVSLTRRIALWACASALLCPPVAAFLLSVGDDVWRWLLVVSNALTITLFENSGGFARSHAETYETISLILAAAAAAVAPTLSFAASERGWREIFGSAITMFPAWTAVMIAPALVICHQARGFDDSRARAFVSADFLILFCAAATAFILAYAIWARLASDEDDADAPDLLLLASAAIRTR